MKFTSVLSLALLLSGEALARSSFQRKSTDEALTSLLTQRQTSRNEIQLRAHVKDTIKRVHVQHAIERDEAIDRALAGKVELEAQTLAARRPARVLTARQADPSNVSSRVVAAGNGAAVQQRRRLDERTRTRVLAARQADPSNVSSRVVAAGNGAAVQQRRRLDDRAPTHVLAARQADPSNVSSRVVAAGNGATTKQRRRYIEEERDEQVALKVVYPKCKKSGKSGYAHYPGWKLVGDELSGAVPVSPELACIQACNKYGGACSGVSFVDNKCFLKGIKTNSWDFVPATKHDGVDLVGGCAMWVNIVPEEMTAVCCTD